MDFRIHLLACALSTVATPALGQEARPIRVRSGRQVQVPMDPARSMPRALGRLPRAAAALYAPRATELLEDLAATATALASIEPALAHQSAPEILADLVWGTRPGLGGATEDGRRALARLAEPEGLRAIGVDPEGPVTLTFDPSQGVALVQLALEDRPRWERLSSELGGAAWTRVEVAKEHARVLAADSDLPLTCLARQATLTCQVGAGPAEAPLAALEAVTSGRGPQLGDVDGLVTAFTALPEGARAVAVLDTPAMAHWLGDLAKAHEDRAHRFARKEVRQRAVAEAQAVGRKVEHIAAKVEGTALGLYRENGAVAVRLESALSEYGAKMLQPHLRTYGEHDLLTRWASTPALAQFILRTHPKTTQRFLEALGLELPARVLTGDLALLTLGVDAECPMAKAKRKELGHHLSWASMLPSAAAVGIAGTAAAESTLVELKAQLPKQDAQEDPREFRGESKGAPYEIVVQDHVMLLGAGYGAAEAARRRLTTSPPRRARHRPPVLEASVDLLAIDAAIGSGALGTEHRPELLALEALRHRVRPLLDAVARLDLSVRAADDGQRLSAKLTMRP